MSSKKKFNFDNIMDSVGLCEDFDEIFKESKETRDRDIEESLLDGRKFSQFGLKKRLINDSQNSQKNVKRPRPASGSRPICNISIDIGQFTQKMMSKVNQQL